MAESESDDRLDVLVVDDSPTYRMILSRTLKGCPFARLAGSAVDGEAALLAIAEKRPDLVLLDVSMPVLDGIETLKRIRAKWHDVDVVMCSGVDQNQTGLTMQALSLGALDFVPKPQGDNPAESFAALGAALHPLLELAMGRRNARRARSSPAKAIPRPPSPIGEAPPARAAKPESVHPVPTASAPAPTSAKPPVATRSSTLPQAVPPTGGPGRRPPARVELVVVGVSTGGPNALQAMVPRIPEGFPAPIVCVQHMPPLFTASLAERLDRASKIRVMEAAEGMVALPGHMYIAQGGRHLDVVRGADGRFRLKLHDAPPVNSCRPSVDVLFDSAAALGIPGIVSVVLTGMGSDGAAGARKLREKGAWSIAQDEATSVVWGMPGAVASQGQADELLPLERVASRLEELVRSGGAR